MGWMEMQRIFGHIFGKNVKTSLETVGAEQREMIGAAAYEYFQHRRVKRGEMGKIRNASTLIWFAKMF